MSNNNQITPEFDQVMADVMLQVQCLLNSEFDKKGDFLLLVNTLLLCIVSMIVDVAELHLPGSAPLIYADVEAAAKSGGLRTIKNIQSTNGAMAYSVSNIDPNDMMTAMNYLGQALSTTLVKSTYKLPISLRKPETWLRGVEVFLASLLHQKFDDL